MRRTRDTRWQRAAWAVAVAGAVAALGACGPRPGADAARPRARPAVPSSPRVRVGGILRLGRAGDLIEAGGGATLEVVVPAARLSTSWQRAVDTQGNQFRVAPGGRLVPDGEPHPEREPASVANVAYYFAQAYALMAARYRRQGLAMAAEVLDLPAADATVQRAQRALCRLFDRLGLKGPVRDKLYANLAAVRHRAGADTVVRNPVHGFALRVPLDWSLLAGSAPRLGPRATVLVFALPGSGETEGASGGRANVLWTTQRAPATGTLAAWAAARLLATPDSARRAVPAPAGRPGALAFEVGPVTYQGRRLASLQVFFAEGGQLHHVTLLAAAAGALATYRAGLRALLGSFHLTHDPHPCDRAGR